MYCAFDSFFIRVPSLYFDFLKEMSFEKQIVDSKIQEAIYLASPELFNELQKYLAGIITNVKEKQRIELALYRYISRMSTRCTPFGLFAGCYMGYIVDGQSDVLFKKPLRHTRLDMHFLYILAQELLKISDIKLNVKYYPNTSLYQVGKKYRYSEYYYVKSQRRYQISTINRSVYIDAILKMAQEGVTIRDLIDYLIKQEFEKEIAVNFVDELVDNQILVSELSPCASGNDYLAQIIYVLNSLNISDTFTSLLKEIQHLLSTIDLDRGNNVILYKNIMLKIKGMKIPYEEESLFQVDLGMSCPHIKLGKNIINELQSTMMFLNKIIPDQRNNILYEFQAAFYRRYEDREVPLLEALDTEIGIGYPLNESSQAISPLLDDFCIPMRDNQKNIFHSHPFLSILLEKTIETMKKNKIEIVFSDEDVKHFKSNWNDLPPTIYSIFKVLKSNYCDAPLIHLIGFYGTCGANLFTRFAYMDEEINRCVKKIVVKEQELMSNVILAEIVHLPNTRLGNILSRTHMRDYEILYLSHANRMESKIINASDLLLSIREGRIFLRSKNLDKEIIPRLTNAHNYSYNAVPIYRFLCDLQKQYGRISLAFNWGYLENELNFLPRVRYKNTILSFACWKIRTSAMKYLFILEDDAQLISEVRKWRKQYMFPSKMVLVDGDNELLVDWEIPLSVRALFSLVKRREMICLREFMFTPKNCLVKDKRGKSYTNECIVAFYKNEMK